MERDAPSPETIVYSFFYICRSPQKGALPRKTYSHRPRSPTRTEGIHTIGFGPVPQGDSREEIGRSLALDTQPI
jgi:hypothetical protein